VSDPVQPVIVVRFIQNRPLFSRLIAWYTTSLWSHVEFGTPQGTWIGAHLSGGIQERPHDYCNPRLEARYALKVTATELEVFLGGLRSEIGTKYNVPAIIGLAIHDRHLNNPSERICSQFVARHLLRQFGAERTWNLLPEWAYLMTPDMVHISPIFCGNRIPGPYL
jgi:hypothetical protein